MSSGFRRQVVVFIWFVLGLLSLTLLGCAKSFDDDETTKIYRNMSEQALYDYALKALKKGDYSDATKRLDAFDTLFPFSRYTKTTQRFMIYSAYQQGDYIQASANAERYVHLYPQDKDVDYAYYMKAMSDFEQQRGSLANFWHLDEAKRDPGSQRQAYDDFLKLVDHFPHSAYRQDALKHLVYIRNMFAQRQLDIAEYYYRKRRYVAALNRANDLIKQYPQAPQSKQALQLAHAANTKLRLPQAAEDDLKVLKNNSQNSS